LLSTLLPKYFKQVRIVIHVKRLSLGVNLCFLIFFFRFVSDGVGWETEIQCRFSTCLPANQGDDILNFYLSSSHPDCTSSHDNPGYCCLHSCLYANWLGNATGECFIFFSILTSLFWTDICYPRSLIMSPRESELIYRWKKKLHLWTLIERKIMHINSNFSFLADCASTKTSSSTSWILGISKNSCSWLWDSHGFAFIHSCCLPGLVSFCFRISDPNVVQPSIQSRIANFSYSWRSKEGALFSQQGIICLHKTLIICSIFSWLQ